MSYQSSEDRAFANGVPRHAYRKTTRKMRWWYESLADYMIANPNATQNEIAANFGRATATISTIVNTDSFKAYFRQRRNAHAERLDAGVRQKMYNVADAGLALILDRFDKKRDTIPIEMLQRTVDSTLKSLGYASEASGPTIVNNVQAAGPPQLIPVAVSVEDLQAAREALRRSQMQIIEPPPLQLANDAEEES